MKYIINILLINNSIFEINNITATNLSKIRDLIKARLTHDSNLTDVHVQNCSISFLTVRGLSNILKSSHNVHSLGFYKCEVTTNAKKKFNKLIQENNFLNHLNLNIDDATFGRYKYNKLPLNNHFLTYLTYNNVSDKKMKIDNYLSADEIKVLAPNQTLVLRLANSLIQKFDTSMSGQNLRIGTLFFTKRLIENY